MVMSLLNLNLQPHHIRNVEKGKPFQLKHHELVSGGGLPVQIHVPKPFITKFKKAHMKGTGIRIPQHIVQGIKSHLHDLGMNVKNAVTDQVNNKAHELINAATGKAKAVSTALLNRVGATNPALKDYVDGQIDHLGNVAHQRSDLSANKFKRIGRVQGGSVASDFRKLGRQIKNTFNPRKIKNTFN